MPKILIADSISDSGVELLKQNADLEVVVQTGLDENALCEAVADAEGIVVRSATKVTAKVIAAAPNLKIIGRAGVGVDNIDLDAATARNIPVVNSPAGNITSAAEHAIAMLFSMARRIPAASAKLKAGNWDKKSHVGNELHGKTLGFVGIGRVARIVAKVARSMDMTVLFSDPYVEENQVTEFGAKKMELAQLFANSDFVSIHAQLTPDTKHMIGADVLSQSKPGLMLVNCARGGIVDEQALHAALTSGQVTAAALDVFETEPCKESPLFALDQVTVTPHLGASTAEAQIRVAEDVARSFLEYFEKGSVSQSVNQVN